MSGTILTVGLAGLHIVEIVSAIMDQYSEV